jgi:ketosteroid isomerase-like protein
MTRGRRFGLGRTLARGGRRLPARLRPALALGAALATLAAGCSFERRAEVEEGPPARRAQGIPAPSPEALAEDSLMSVIDAFHRALESGDAARLATLMGPDALLVDQEEGVLWTTEGSSPLPSALDAGQLAPNGLRWQRVGTRVDAVGPARLVVLRYRAAIAGEAVPWWAVESLLIEPDEDGRWRLRYLHRSRGTGGS